MKVPAACAIATLAICDGFWASQTGLKFYDWTQAAILMGLLLALGLFYGSIRRNTQLADMALWGALVVAFTFAAAIFTYLAATLGFPLVDRELAGMDAALGFHWPVWFEFVNSHRSLKVVLAVAYAILLPECVALIIYFAHRGRSDRNAEFLWGALISLLITAAISGIAPAVGAFVHFGVPGPAAATYLPHFLALRDGTVSSFSVNEIQGIITMPSYHTVLALLVIYAFRGCGRWFTLALALNGVMLLSLPSEGGHYLVDVVAGGAVTAFTIAIVGAVRRRGWLQRSPPGAKGPPADAALSARSCRSA